MVISVDFDDTIVYNKYPDIGELIPNADSVINYWYSRGHQIIIDSCRTGKAEKQMVDALNYYEIKHDWVNKNSPRLIRKYKSDTRKISCDLRVDDTNFLLARDIKLEGKDVVLSNIWEIMDDSMLFMEKPLVICIIGESGAGKSLLADYFQYEYGISVIQSYTDRPRRANNEGGHTFLSPRQMDKVLERETLAFTKFGDYRYACLADDLQSCNIYVIDEIGVKMLDKNWSDSLDIYTIRLHRDYDKRLASVGQERINRDDGRYNLSNTYFDYVIQNVTDDIQILHQEADDFIKKYRLKGRLEPYQTLIIDE